MKRGAEGGKGGGGDGWGSSICICTYEHTAQDLDVSSESCRNTNGGGACYKKAQIIGKST